MLMKLTDEDLKEILKEDVSPEEIVRRLEVWAGTNSYEDDITILTLEYRPEA